MTEHASGRGPTQGQDEFTKWVLARMVGGVPSNGRGYESSVDALLKEAKKRIALALSDAYERGRRDGMAGAKRLEHIAIAAECLVDYIEDANEAQIEMVGVSYSFEELKRALSTQPDEKEAK